MKKKHLFLAATAIFIASCSDNSYLGDQAAIGEGVGGPISFNYEIPAATRSDVTTAGKLSNQFIVWGEKNEDQSAAGATPTDGNLVFPNYVVNFSDNTDNTTTSNTSNWEYVGFTFDEATSTTSSYTDNISPNTKPTSGSIPVQTIKYWDNNATSYTFTAVSAKPADITAGRVKIVKTVSGSDVYKKGYEVTLAKTDGSPDVYPDWSYLYFADRINIAKSTGYSYAPVTFNFRNALSHVRVGMYETIPGYDVTAISFKVTGDALAKNNSNDAFGAICPNVSPGTFTGKITVTYYDATDADTQNHPKLELTTTTTGSATDLILGTNINAISTSTPLAISAATPTYDKSDKTYTPVLPQINNSSPLQLKVSYTLHNSVTGETINISDKTAKVPAQYLQWKPNFKYTYLFKITDDNLNPITFDAVVVTDESTGKQETITTVSEPSITTFGYDETNNIYVASSNDYAAGKDIYVTIMDGGSVVVPTPHNNFHLYSNIVSSDPTNFPITEASVKEAIEVASTGTKKITFDHPCNEANSWFDTHCIAVTSVPAEDGTTKTVNAVKLTGLTAGTYAVQYRKTGGADDYTKVDVTGFVEGTTDVSSYFIRNYTYTACGASATAVDGTKYYSESGGVYTEVTGLSVGADVSSYYTRNDVFTYVQATGKYDASVDYYQTAGGALSAGNNYYKVIIVH